LLVIRGTQKLELEVVPEEKNPAEK